MMMTVTPRISSGSTEGRRSCLGAGATKSNALTPAGMGPTASCEERLMRIRQVGAARSACTRMTAPMSASIHNAFLRPGRTHPCTNQAPGRTPRSSPSQRRSSATRDLDVSEAVDMTHNQDTVRGRWPPLAEGLTSGAVPAFPASSHSLPRRASPLTSHPSAFPTAARRVRSSLSISVSATPTVPCLMLTFSKRRDGLEFDPEVIVIVELGRVVDQLDVADVDLECQVKRLGRGRYLR